jgi:branched-chain amino acid transport system substrate-binding protein
VIARSQGRTAWAVAVLALSVLAAAGCGGGSSNSSSTSAAGGGGSTGGGGGGGGSGGVSLSNCSAITGKGDLTIVSDLPLQGASRLQTTQMVSAIQYVLKQKNYKAGKYTVQYQSCDDATAQAGKWDSATCSANARAYAQAKDVIGVIGTFNSGCAEIEIPVLNKVSVGMVSPANTYVGLTHGGPGTAPGEPDKYYPTGKRNYIRIVAADDFQGAADALLAQQLGVKTVYILNDKEAYGLGVATNFKNAATKLGIKVVGFSAWDLKASNYQSLMQQIGQKKPDAIFLGGLICENGAQLIKDKVSVLGPNTGKVKLIAPDGFTTSATITGPGSAGPKNAEGMYMSVAGAPPEKLKGAGATFVSGFKTAKSVSSVEPYTAYAAQAAEVLLAAIAKSDGSRESVTAQLFKTKVTNGILGSFTINKNGDTNSNPVTIDIANRGKLKTYKVITPSTDLVAAA